MHYGPNNYATWWFSDNKSYSHSLQTPSNFFKTREWYYFAAVVDYKNGKYYAYVLNSERKVVFTNTKTVDANQGVGLTKEKAYLVIGGHVNRWGYENFYG